MRSPLRLLILLALLLCLVVATCGEQSILVGAGKSKSPVIVEQVSECEASCVIALCFFRLRVQLLAIRRALRLHLSMRSH